MPVPAPPAAAKFSEVNLLLHLLSKMTTELTLEKFDLSAAAAPKEAEGESKVAGKSRVGNVGVNAAAVGLFGEEDDDDDEMFAAPMKSAVKSRSIF